MELNKENHQAFSFGSYRPSDASLLIADTIGMAMVSTMRTTGLHRTRSEIDGRGAIDETLWGGYYQYSGQSFRAGIGGAAVPPATGLPKASVRCTDCSISKAVG